VRRSADAKSVLSCQWKWIGCALVGDHTEPPSLPEPLELPEDDPELEPLEPPEEEPEPEPLELPEDDPELEPPELPEDDPELEPLEPPLPDPGSAVSDPASSL
jgi:hypothetical protein